MRQPTAPQPALRSIARAFFAALSTCACLLVFTSSALAAGPTVTIGTVPLNSTSPTFTFTADAPVLKFQCRLDSPPSAAADCTSPVQFSGLAVNVLHTFSVRAFGLDDVAGDWMSFQWTIDNVRPPIPLITAPADNLLTNFPSPTFSGTAEPLARVPIFDGPAQLGSPTAGIDGHWTFTPPAPLEDGIHLWRVRAIDGSGNASDFSAIRTLRIDTQPPDAPVVTAPTEGAKINTRFPVISGTSEPQTTIAVDEGPTRICSTSTDPNGTWACTSTVSLLDGPHQLTVGARDQAGNESDTTVRNFDLDATPPPAPTIISPSDGTSISAEGLIVSGTASPLGSVKLLIGPDEVADEPVALDGTWTHQFDLVPEGDLTFSAKEIDDFGNRSLASNLVHVHVDRTQPVVTIASHPPVRTNQTNAGFGFTASEAGVLFECALDAADWQSCGTAPEFGGLGEGGHLLKLRGTDPTGNLSSNTAVFTWTVDLTPPAAPTIDAPAEDATVTNARPPVSGHAEPGSSVEVYVGAVSQGTAPVSSGAGTWTLTPAAALAQGATQVKARTTDAAGNAGPLSTVRNFTIDSVAPTTTIQGAPTTPTNAAAVTVSFSANDLAATFTCSIDNFAFAACTSPFTMSSLGEGNHILRVRARDVAGNVESPPQVASFRIDRTAPVGHSSLIAGSAAATGVPAFAIVSDDPAASAQCKIDNGAYAACAGNYRPSAGIGIHALTIRFTDAAGNVGDQVIAFNVTAPEPPPNYYEQPPPVATCQVLGAAGLTTGKLKILTASSSKRTFKFTVSAGARSLLRADVVESGSTIGSGAFAVGSGKSKLTLSLKRAPATGKKLELAVRFYSVKREYGTAHLALTSTKAGVRIAASAQSTLDVLCPKPVGASAKPKFTAAGAVAGSRSFKLKPKGKSPALIALKLTRAGESKPVLSTLLVAPAAPELLKVKLPGSTKLQRGAYKFSFDAISAGGVASSGRGAFSVR